VTIVLTGEQLLAHAERMALFQAAVAIYCADLGAAQALPEMARRLDLPVPATCVTLARDFWHATNVPAL
jgi:hypothetical protein